MYQVLLSLLFVSVASRLVYAATECGPRETLYYDPETRSSGCCQEGGTVTWQDQKAYLGFCCAPGHDWTGDISTGEGGCCPIGMVMVDGMCVDKDSPEAKQHKTESKTSGCGCHHHASLDSEAEDLDETDETGPEFADSDSSTVDLGIRYGQCYRLIVVPSGKEVGSNRENTVYTPGGLFTNIPFRVCKSPRDCVGSMPDPDFVVSSQSRFYLQDQMGRYNDASATPGWVSSTTRGPLKMKFTKENDDAASFVGTLSTNPEWCEEESGCIALKLSSIPLTLQFSYIECIFESETGSGRVKDEL
ncbi:hypothetical protein VKT23_018913 [Stygiomarasmius scandens]|uniref:Uncharacterized protein n=1 Tax=Marasmiellus scandens TaxID=2682957 RepID=A0ABR1IRZ9_9AGAR